MPHDSRQRLVLGIETATALGGVALVGPGGLVGESTLRSPRSHSERLLPAVERLLADAGGPDVAAVAVSSGPGSFTGLRTGIAAAKGLAFARGVPLYGIPTLEVLAAGAAAGHVPVCVVVRARRGEWYRGEYGGGPPWPEPLRPERVVAEAGLLDGLAGGTILAGDLTPALLAVARNRGLVAAPVLLCHPRAAAVALRGLERFQAGEADECANLVPRYLRPPEARVRDIPSKSDISKQ